MLFVGVQGLAVLLRVAGINRTVLEKSHRALLTVEVVGDHLKPSQQQGLPHHVQVGAQRIHYPHALFLRPGLQFAVVLRTRQRIVHHFHESVGGEEVGNGVAHRLGFRSGRRIDGYLHSARQFDIVVAIYAQNLLHDVALPGDIDHIRRCSDKRSLRASVFVATAADEIVVEIYEYIFYCLPADFLAYEGLDARVVEFYAPALQGGGLHFLHLAAYMPACKRSNQQGGASGGPRHDKRVAATFVAERCVCLQAVPLGGLAYGRRVEICALKEYIHRSVADAGLFSAENACQAHGFAAVGYHQVAGTETALHTVEGHELLALGSHPDDHFAAFDLCSVESVQRLSGLHKYEIGDIDYIVYRPEAYAQKLFLHPVRRRSHLDAAYGNAAVTWRSFRSQHLYRYGLTLALGECGDVGYIQFAGNAVVAEIGVEVPGHSDMRGGINPVGSQSNLYYSVGLELEIFLCACAGNGCRIEDHNAFVAVSDAQLILGAYHSERLHAAYLGLLDLEILSKHSAYGCQQHLLAGSHVRRTADDLQQLLLSGIELCNVKMVRIRMLHALHDLGNDYAGKASRNLLDLFEGVHLKSNRGQGLAHLLRTELTLKVILQPVVRNLHICFSVLL